ncbi:hypothetical protein [Flagellimonas allohymeniacidonis]|uniref:Uncharacterized protein n=1 Tax=Flagellimonas allohymeniacidonis TaxID=2517819 RepID=A0A4Q8QF27_9FLAO|nr:hypothetical protein [Allomuricauda hymeniacidonis]TAI47798.1 hypothetical protein EW142_14160 [Allomuricauda hymeniacidonis]
MNEKKHTKYKTKYWLIASVIVLLAATIGAYKFVNGYLVKMTLNEDGTGQGYMKTPDILDMMLFFGIIAIGLLGLVLTIVNLVRIVRN